MVGFYTPRILTAGKYTLKVMFVTVRYGDDQSKIFNINCKNEILLHHIKKRCEMDRDEIIELSDETGTVKNLRQNLHDYGTDYLKERETLVLLKVDSAMGASEGDELDSLSDRTIYIPMLTAMSEDQEFIESLNPKDHMGSKNSLFDDDKGKKSKNKDKKKDKKAKDKAAKATKNPAGS